MNNIVKLNEEQLLNVIKESVKEALNELSTGTIVRAKQKAYNNLVSNDGLPVKRANGKYLNNDGYTQMKMRQLGAFNDEYNNRTNNQTSCPSDMSQEQFNQAKANGWKNEDVVREGAIKKKSPYHYLLKKTTCPECGKKEGSGMYGGLCPDCAKAKNKAQSMRGFNESVN